MLKIKRLAFGLILVLPLVILLGLLLWVVAEGAGHVVGQEGHYLPIIFKAGPTARPTPTLAKTPTPRQRQMPTNAPTMDVCPLCPTKTPFVICLPDPCDGG